MSDSKFDPQQSPPRLTADLEAPDGVAHDLLPANDDVDAPAPNVDAVRFWLHLVGLP